MIFFIKFVLKIFFIATLFFGSSIIIAEESGAVKIFIAKDIVTLNKNNDSVEAIATKGSKIINVGSKKELGVIWKNNYQVPKNIKIKVLFPV